MAQILDAGGELLNLKPALQRLRDRRELPDAFNDHALSGKLEGLRSAVVGWTSEGRNIVMVYAVKKQFVQVMLVDEHDAAYQVLRTEKALKRKTRRSSKEPYEES